MPFGTSRGALALAAHCLLLHGVVIAHPILISAGTLDVSPTSITARFEISRHDVEHDGMSPDDPGSFDRFAERLAEGMAILTPCGERLGIKSVRVDPPTIEHEVRPPTTGTIEYVPPETLDFLTFQQRPSAEGPPVRRQLQMEVRVHGAIVSELQTIRLTSDGNVETLCTAADASCAAFDPKRLGSIRLFVVGDSSKPIIRVEAPAHLLATWAPFSTRNPDVIGMEEAAAMCSALAEWALRQVTLSLDDRPTTMNASQPAWLMPDGRPPAGPIGFWSARFSITLTPTVEMAHTRAKFTWRGFNTAVLTADAELNREGAVETRRLLPGSATLEWD